MNETLLRFHSFLFIFLFTFALTVISKYATINQQSTIDNIFSISQDGNSTRDYWPTYGWRNSTPAAEGMSARILDDMISHIEDQDYPIDSVFIVRNGYAVFESYPSGLYYPTRKHDMHSVSKSFTSTLIGIALQQALLESVNQHLLDFFPEYTPANPDSRKSDITIEDLLTMSAGLEWDESSLPFTDPDVNDLGGLMASSDVVQFVLDKPMVHDPGEVFLYSGGVTTLLGAIVQQCSGLSTTRFADEYLFEPLGFGSTTWYLFPGGWCNAQGGLRVNTRDMAKLGFLYLNNGTWNGTQILSSSYVSNATTPHFTDLYFPPEYAGYGWQWWLAPDMETFMACGRMGQKIIVSRELDLVVVFTARVGDLDYDPEYDLYTDYILQAIALGPDANQTLIPSDFTVPAIIISGVAGVGIFVLFYRKKSSS